MPVDEPSILLLQDLSLAGIVWESSGIEPMPTVTVRNRSNEALKVVCRWKGKNLSVHRMIVQRDDCNRWGLLPRSENRAWGWTVTHNHTGYAAGRFQSLDDAISAAKQADWLFVQHDQEDIKCNEHLKSTWRDIVNNRRGLVGA